MYILAPTSDYLAHSAKGSEWKKHLYIKRVDGTYYYPDSYEGGRHLPDSKDSEKSKKTNKKETEDEKKKKSEESAAVISRISEITGMKEEACEELLKIAKTKGFDSAEYKEHLKTLSEGSDYNALRIDNLIKGNIDKYVEEEKFTEKDIENLAKEVIRGNFGNGNDRKERFGEYYDAVQKRVNELMKSSGSKTSSKKSEKSEKKSSKKDSKKEEKKKETKEEPKEPTAEEIARENEKKQRARISKNYKSLKHGIEIPAYVVKPSKRIIYW